MNFDLALPLDQFAGMDRVARSLLANSRMEPRELRTITSDSSVLPADSQSYLVDNPSSLGVCFGEPDDRTFDIWVSPAFDTRSAFYTDTVLHELSHGYFGIYVHNHRWRRLLGRVLHHYDSLVAPLATEPLIKSMLYRYTQQGVLESTEQYDQRLVDEASSIANLAVDELPYIARTFARLSTKESLSGRATGFTSVG